MLSPLPTPFQRVLDVGTVAALRRKDELVLAKQVVGPADKIEASHTGTLSILLDEPKLTRGGQQIVGPKNKKAPKILSLRTWLPTID